MTNIPGDDGADPTEIPDNTSVEPSRRAAKTLEEMRRNPQGDWRIDDVQAVSRAFGVDCDPPTRGGHYTVSHPGNAGTLTIPFNRPVKPVYIRKSVKFVDAVRNQKPSAS